MAVSGGCFQAQGFEELELFQVLAREGSLGCRADTGDMLLNAFEKTSGTRACAVPLGFEPHAHDAVEYQRQEADHGVSAVTVGKPVDAPAQSQCRPQDTEAALDVRQSLVARDGLIGSEVGGFGDQRKLAAEELGLGGGIAVKYLEAKH